MIQGENVAAVVVVYNVFCGDSPTCKALENHRDLCGTVLIFDNSTRDLGNRAWCEKRGFSYLGGEGNLGISKAYNKSLDFIREKESVEIVCLFDDDTHVNKAYFESLLLAAQEEKPSVFLPLIYTGETLLSPCRLDDNFLVAPFSNEKEALCYTGNDLSGINTGMAIRRSVFSEYRYDENVFLDGVDHRFMLDMRGRGVLIRVFPYRCHHEFSGAERPPKKAALTRFCIYAKDYRYLLKNRPLAYLKLVGKRALRLTLQYRSLAFVKILLGERPLEGKKK